MLVEDHFRDGKLLNEFVKNKLKLIANDNEPLTEDLFTTVTHFWNNLNCKVPSPQWDELWEDIRFDHSNSSISVAKESMEDWLLSLSQPVEYRTDSDPFDFGAFIPKRLLSSMLGFNGKTESILGDILSRNAIIETPNDYNSNIEYWGSKWNIHSDNVQTIIEDEHISLNFDTAWSPVLPVISSMVKHYPELVVDYTFFEVGMNFCGRFVCTQGEILFSAEQNDGLDFNDHDDGGWEIHFPDWFERDLDQILEGVCH